VHDSYVQSNVERFSGFEDLYDNHRPEAPMTVVEVITSYLERKPGLVVDLGCGTGLSTFVWKDHAERIIGIEPNDDMRGKAEAKRAAMQGMNHLSFVKGYSYQMDLPSESVDVITCSQSFHWMEPASTLKEAGRVLADGGIFAAYDCDWPPTVHWRIEEAYNRLIEKGDEVIARHTGEHSRVKKWNKAEHLQRLQESGVFRFTKEIVFHQMAPFDAKRFTGLALSQGGLQTVFKLGTDELDEELQRFRDMVERYFRDRTIDVMLSYRMRLGVKAAR